jgi:multimeric flavodoxin WrbA
MLSRVIAFNGSGRKNWNTAQLAMKFLEGARSEGAQTELVHLSDLNFRGCQGCLACKEIGTPHYGRCVQKDDLTKYLNSVEQYSVMAFATPVFMMGESGMMRSLLERLFFQYLDYAPVISKFTGKTKMAYLATMNLWDELLEQQRKSIGFPPDGTQDTLRRMFGNCSRVYATDTLQCNDYAKHHIMKFNEANKKKRHAEQFPIDLQHAFELGAKLVRESRQS